MVNLVGPKDLAAILKVSESTIYYWVQRNEIPFLKVGKHLRFNVDEVLCFFTDKTAQSKANCHQYRDQLQNKRGRSLTTGASARARNFASQKEE